MDNLNHKEHKYQSNDLNHLYEALAKVQGELKPVRSNKYNPFFKSDYADLLAVVDGSREILSKYGLSVIQLIQTFDDGTFMLCRLGHASGQWIESKMKITPPKERDVHALGSYISYIRRYLYSSMLGIVVSDEDDDGNSNVSALEESKKINKSQVDMLEKALLGHKELRNIVLNSLKISSFEEMSPSKFNEIYQKILKKISETKNPNS